MRGPAVTPVVIAAGGTGGHFFPAEALAAELLKRGHRIVLMADARSGGLTSPVFAGHERYVISGAGIAGRGVVRGVKATAALVRGIAQARRILGRINAAAVVGFGGYPTVAPVLAARLLRRRPAIILQEQNAVMGRANRFLARQADVVALNFAATQKLPPSVARVVTGNPIRPAIQALSATPYEAPFAEGSISVLVLGGSLGARVFSDVVPPALTSLPGALRARLSVVQQCRTEDLDRVRAAYEQAGIPAELSPFFPDVAARLSAARMVIARAGASTVAELAVAGRPSILVPLPGAIDNHQMANAEALANSGGAWVISQPQFTPEILAKRLAGLLADPDLLTKASAAARRQARPDAAELLANLVEEQLRQRVEAAGERT